MQVKTETRVGIFVILAIGLIFYMTIFLGVFRLDRGKYNEYIVYFDDISGIEKKAKVKIAGVDVGWVEKIELVHDDGHQAKAFIMVLRRYVLHSDSYAIVRPEGLLGTKYLEVVPGDPMLPELPSGSPLKKPGRSQTSVDKILNKVHEIATHVEDVTGSIRESLGGVSGRDSFEEIIKNFNTTAQSIAAFSEKLDRTLSTNEANVSDIITGFRDFAHNLRETVPNIHRFSEKLEYDFIPAMQSNLDKIANVVDRDFSGLAQEAESSFKNIREVTKKIDEGEGLIGKLINDDATYYDIKQAAAGVKNYLSKVDNLNVVIDTHGEYMYRPGEHIPIEDTKGYFDIRIHPNEDHFYIVQIVGTIRGNLQRRTLWRNWYDERGDQYFSRDFVDTGRFLPELVGRIDTIKRKWDTYRYGAQIAKIYKDLCLRFGLIEGFVGMGVDVNIPFRTDKFRWILTLEAFDFRGRDRIDDARPHLKWINRVFILRNLYAAFGADDFISKYNSNAFFGFGLRFCDDDLKYLASKVGFIGT